MRGSPGVWPRVAIVLASVVLLVSMLLTWVRAQILDTGGWTRTSVQLLQNTTIRHALSNTLATKVLTAVDVNRVASDKLPPRLQPLAPVLSSTAAEVVPGAVDRLLQTPAVQSAWEAGNRRAHQQLTRLLNGGGSALRTEGGVVAIDLHAVLNRIGEGLGVGRVGDKLPPAGRELVLLRSRQLHAAQRGVHALRALAFVLPAVVLALYLLALALAATGRRRTLLEIGIALAVASLLSLVLRRWMQSYVVDNLVSHPGLRPAAHDVLAIATAGWRDEALWLLVNGILVVLCAMLAGPTTVAVAIRARLARPLWTHPAWFAAGAVVLVLVIATVGPGRTPGQAIPLLAELVLAVIGVLALCRQIAHEHIATSLRGSDSPATGEE